MNTVQSPTRTLPMLLDNQHAPLALHLLLAHHAEQPLISALLASSLLVGCFSVKIYNKSAPLSGTPREETWAEYDYTQHQRD